MLSTSAYASGFGLRDASASTLGLSYAGNAANGSVPTTMVFNPATVNDVETFDFAVSNTGLLPQTSGDFTATTAAGTPVSGNTHPVDIVNTALIPSLAVRYRLTDKIAMGLQFSTPWGMITDYDKSVTRYYATMSDVKSANMMAIIGYQLTPEFSIAGGLQVQYLKGRLAKAIDIGTITYGLYHSTPPRFPNLGQTPGGNDGFVELRAQDWATGWIIGAEWKPTPNLTFGASYRSAIYNRLKGNEYFTLDAVGQAFSAGSGMFKNGAASGKLHNPPVVTLGAKWDIDSQWSLMVGADWTGWSIVKNLTIHSGNPAQGDDVTLFNYHDSWFGSVGLQYKPTEDWRLSIGTGFDDTPTDTEYRTPGIPDGGRYWLSAGVGYRVTQNIDLDLSVARLIAEKGNIKLSMSEPTNAASYRGNLTGTVNMRVTLVGLELNYHL
ncbi:OmpP1/FadL family transporter [Rhizomicrobium electricum]|uniref:OmpP1/FadL family transporter n=1 Tax=Rhizomicrobium electricum TaxID=480070 RepID=UPI0014249696|nr:outer membrane protein transport protein [Rhizomicrobium electricum]NIJ47969.1 long-chain fatty acid transport protein [Rhizomicrobium electricum]